MKEFPTRLGSKSGLFRSKIGLNMTVASGLFRYGKIRVECVGEVADGVIKGVSHGATHELEEIRLPKALKREMTKVFVSK